MIQHLAKPLLLHATAVAMVLQLLVPAGYMAASVGSGWPLQICHSGLPAAVHAALTGADHHTSHHHHGHHDHNTADDAAVTHADQGPCELGSGIAPGLASESPRIALEPTATRQLAQMALRQRLTTAPLRAYDTRAPPFLS